MNDQQMRNLASVHASQDATRRVMGKAEPVWPRHNLVYDKAYAKAWKDNTGQDLYALAGKKQPR